MVTINEDVHRPHRSRNVCSTPNFTNETGLYPGVTSGSWWDGAMVLPRFRHRLGILLGRFPPRGLELVLAGIPWVGERGSRAWGHVAQECPLQDRTGM